ncbi:MAG: 50S ribosomal protein L30 [Nanoarchaeota archaeon]|nr:50S ribosomal protein L30 [Nanoarchaeota archaeon]
MNNKPIAVIRIRGRSNVTKKINDTLDMLRLYKQNGCVIVPSTPTFVGMIKKAKDYITWGEINEETLALLLESRGKIVGNNPLTEDYLKSKLKLDFKAFVKEVFEGKKNVKDIPGIKAYFRLMPPVKGFARQGIKKPFSMGGALGYRKDKINDLIKRMI